MTDNCETCSHLHFVKSDDGAIDNTQICDIDGFFIVRAVTHRCKHWTNRESKEKNITLLDSRHLDSRVLMDFVKN